MSEKLRRGKAAGRSLIKSSVSRRGLLNGSAALGAHLLLPRSAGAQHQGHDHSKMGLDPGPIVQAAAASMDQPLLEPEVRRSVNGELRTTLSLPAMPTRDIGGQRLYLRSYEGASSRPDAAHEARRDADASG